MHSISELKELAVTDTPLLVFDCVLTNGQTERWSTHKVTVSGNAYAARVLEHSVFEIQTASDQGIDGSPKISLLLANADSHFSEIERACGWKGARLTVSFLFYDLPNDTATTASGVVFQGICNPPDLISEPTLRLTAMNRMNLQRVLLPQIRIQRRCPWEFPATGAQRTEAVGGGTNGKYSRYYRCGYSPDVAGGSGALDGVAPFTSCNYTRADCEARGLLRRFGGLEYVPSAVAVRAYGKDWSTSALAINEARYNDFVPMVYGTAWYSPLKVFARNDGNLTRMEVLLGAGEMQGVLTVLVNDVEIPLGQSGTNMTGTGWYNVPTLGTRDGGFDYNFLDSGGNPAGDPYGSMGYLAIAVPTSLSSGSSLPSVKVLAQGLKVPVYGSNGSLLGEQFSSNPAWIVLDVLRRSGWSPEEIDLGSFAATAQYCDERIAATDLNGNAITLPRFECNVVLKNRRSAGDLVRGIRNAARLYLTYSANGRLELRVENTAALEKPSKPECSNSTEPLNGGWASYEFGDGTSGFSGILRRANGDPSLTVRSRSIADTANRLSVEFQDSLNEYQQDSYSMLDPDDVARAGQEVSATLQALGIPNYDQAGRILKFNLDKSIRGNTYIEFETSVKAFGIKPGDLITVTYLKEGFNRKPFRVQKISPATNYRTAKITAQIHDDAWYTDTNGQSDAAGGTRHAPTGAGIPRPLIGTVLDANGNVQFGVEETTATASDGTAETSVRVSFTAPRPTGLDGCPTVSLAAQIGTGGTLEGGRSFYYAVSAKDSAGSESALSFFVRAEIRANGSSVTLTGLSFPRRTSTFSVYRGVTPSEVFRIAADLPLATTFTDTGLPNQLAGPPDANFDHANFYWRTELQPETAATIHTNTTVGNASLAMPANEYRGMTVRITRGPGAGQERTIAANDSTTLTVMTAWDVHPDATSQFAVSEAGWHFGALAKSSPVEFSIPNHWGEVVQITGRAANANDAECAEAISTVTRWTTGGSGKSDSDVPPKPYFGLAAKRGTVELSGISFTDLTNTRTISAATLDLYYRDELKGSPSIALAIGVAASDVTLTVNSPGDPQAGDIVQIDREVMRVNAVSGTQYTVTRGVHGSTAAQHAAQAAVYQLSRRTAIAAFPEDFFGSAYSGNWTYSIPLPDARVASAELFVTNRHGDSPTASITVTHNDDCGLRTLSGGQYSIQVEGHLAVDESVAPPVVVEAAHAVRDVYAVLGTVADAPVTVRVNVDGTCYCTLTFATGMPVSSAVSGTTLAPLAAGAKITASVLSVGQTYPGADLTVLIRL